MIGDGSSPASSSSTTGSASGSATAWGTVSGSVSGSVSIFDPRGQDRLDLGVRHQLARRGQVDAGHADQPTVDREVRPGHLVTQG